MQLIDDDEWRIKIFQAGIGRCFDYKSFDFIKHLFKDSVDQTEWLHETFGILHFFNPHRPNGSYQLDISKFEDKQVFKMLIELCRAEGWNCMTEIKFRGREIEKMNNDEVKSIVEYGVFECTYECPFDKAKTDSREKIGAKYLGNPKQTDWI